MPAANAGPEGDESGPEEFLVGDLMLTRTFRLAGDGRLYPVFTTAPWTAGTITAFCKQGGRHTAPASDCRCGFYAYSDPAYLGEQPPWRQVAAVVAFTGAVELGTRGARAQHARLAAVWLGPQVTPDLEARVAGNYPGVAFYRDRDLMFAEHPLTGPPIFPAPRYGVETRASGRRALRAYLLAAFIGGLVPAVVGLTSPVGALVWVALLLGAIAVVMISRIDRSPLVALAGWTALGWLMPSFSPIANFSHTQAFVAGVMAIGFWQYRARPGRAAPRPHPSGWRPAT